MRMIFAKGQPAPSSFFTGTAWVNNPA
jgi:hypothetical protein